MGVTGYAGQELLRLLVKHPHASIEYLGSRQVSAPRPLGEIVPTFRSQIPNGLRVEPLEPAGPLEPTQALKRCELIFLALPHGVAMGLVPPMLKKPRMRVIDLSGDFRLTSRQRFTQAYGLKRTAASLLPKAVYGLPEWKRTEIRGARLVANPGCYATATLLGLAPLAKEGLLKSDGLIVDAKSGVTGAGRSLKEELLFPEVNEDLRAYRVNQHQHIPEIEQELAVLRKRTVRITFVPHLVPLNRGLYATLYAPLSKRLSDSRLRALYRKHYEKEPFIRLLPEGSWPSMKSVAGTNQCEIGLASNPKTESAIVVAAIDNLGKGAAGQAVQNMNLLFGLPETLGLG